MIQPRRHPWRDGDAGLPRPCTQCLGGDVCSLSGRHSSKKRLQKKKGGGNSIYSCRCGTLRVMSPCTLPPPPLVYPCIQIQIALLPGKVHTGVGDSIVDLTGAFEGKDEVLRRQLLYGPWTDTLLWWPCCHCRAPCCSLSWRSRYLSHGCPPLFVWPEF